MQRKDNSLRFPPDSSPVVGAVGVDGGYGGGLMETAVVVRVGGAAHVELVLRRAPPPAVESGGEEDGDGGGGESEAENHCTLNSAHLKYSSRKTEIFQSDTD